MKKLAIVGTSYNNELAPYHDQDYEIWGMAFALIQSEVKRIDKIFELHLKSEYSQDTSQFIYDTELPVYMQKKDKKVKNCLLFPFEEIRKKYGDYFTSTWALALVFAIEEGFKDIELYGINFETDRERTIERACIEYYIGYFRGLGYKITLPESCPLLKSNYFYGLDDILKHRKRIEKKIDFYGREKLKYYLKFIQSENGSEEEKIYYGKYNQYIGFIQGLQMELNQI